jgi:hypothetical protein
VPNSTVSRPLGSVGSGAVTAAALAVQTGLAAVVGVVLARAVGRGPETDGFFSAYVLFVVVVLAANAVRVTVLPTFARARDDGRLGGELAAHGLMLAAFALPLVLLALLVPGQLGGVLTGEPAGVARDTAAAALPWMMLAAVGQLFAGLAASALASLDDYRTAAFGFMGASAAGLALILWRVGADGVQALAWGMALNGAVAFLVPAVALALRARSERAPRAAARPAGGAYGGRVAVLAAGVALPLALQALYVVCNRFAYAEGAGAQTSLGFAYLIVSAVVAVTASSLGLVTAVPLTRIGLDAAHVARHVLSSAWLAIVVTGAAAGVFGLAGGRIAAAVLGPAYARDVGRELGWLVVALAPWAVVSIGAAVAFPLVFVAGRTRPLPAIAAAALCLHVPLAWALGRLFGLPGLAAALALSTGAALVALLVVLGAVRTTAPPLARAAVPVAGIALAAFGAAALALPPVAAAAAGPALYGAGIGLGRRRATVSAWRYLRALA